MTKDKADLLKNVCDWIKKYAYDYLNQEYLPDSDYPQANIDTVKLTEDLFTYIKRETENSESTLNEDEKNIEACRIAVRNSYLKCLFGDPQLAWVFFNGMEYGRTGKIPKDLLDDEDFIRGNVND